MVRTIVRLVDRQAPSILRSLFYIILVCILVLAVDVMLLQYSRNSRSNQLFSYDNMGMPQRRSRPSLGECSHFCRSDSVQI